MTLEAALDGCGVELAWVRARLESLSWDVTALEEVDTAFVNSNGTSCEKFRDCWPGAEIRALAPLAAWPLDCDSGPLSAFWRALAPGLLGRPCCFNCVVTFRNGVTVSTPALSSSLPKLLRLVA
jgi:hypothetical protein